MCEQSHSLASCGCSVYLSFLYENCSFLEVFVFFLNKLDFNWFSVGKEKEIEGKK